jgi:RNA polymerase sigma factor (sigma-70 family)
MSTSLSDRPAELKPGSPLGQLTDAQLLGLFLEGLGKKSEDAFKELVDRHGPLVYRACRSIVVDEHEAQDAFQTTFLVLAKKSRGLWVRDSLAPWLHGVACRVAGDARKAAVRRRNMHRRMSAIRATSPAIEVPGDIDEQATILHEEIGRLPVLHRSALILCDLQGKTHDEAARLLDCPVGTVKSRQSRARVRLRSRLAGRGLVLSSLLPWRMLTEQRSAAGVVSAADPTAGRVARRHESAQQGDPLGPPPPDAGFLDLMVSASTATAIAGTRRLLSRGILLSASVVAVAVLIVAPVSLDWLAARSNPRPPSSSSLASLRWKRNQPGSGQSRVTKVPFSPIVTGSSLSGR